MPNTGQWFGTRRLVLKTRHAVERAGARVRERLSREPASLAFDDIHRRLELVLTAAYGRPMAIAANDEPGWMGRELRRLMPFGHRHETPTVDGDTIKLPARLMIGGNERQATDRYRLFAIEQAERIMRGTLAHAQIRDPLERDLYLLREGAAIDANIARTYPGMRSALNDERATALTRRPRPQRLTTSERDVEALLRATLSGAHDEADATSIDPTASLAWARETAQEIRRRGDAYRGLDLAPAWGVVNPVAAARREGPPPPASMLPGGKPTSGAQGTPREDRARPSRAPNKNSKSPDAQPHKDGQSSSDAGAPPKRNTVSLDPPSSSAPVDTQSLVQPHGKQRDPQAQSTKNLPPAIYYDEWNAERGSYLRSAAAVRIHEAASGDSAWLREELQKHVSTTRQIRHQFERLRARRTLSVRQQRGDALDIEACVEAMTARRMGEAPDDRLYVDARPARRGLAISLVIDASGSTDQRVTEAWRIIDIEKIALLLATQALDALGDLYAIYAFAGGQASNVKVTVVKDFAESNSEVITRRIAALTPSGFTRMGAALRHATHELARQTAGHRLLLLLSDGRPNDVDVYQGTYGVEDSRQAILEARASGVYPYCLTIDQSASEYLPRIFGKAGHVVLQKPEQLPKALLAVVRGLIKQ